MSYCKLGVRQDKNGKWYKLYRNPKTKHVVRQPWNPMSEYRKYIAAYFSAPLIDCTKKVYRYFNDDIAADIGSGRYDEDMLYAM